MKVLSGRVVDGKIEFEASLVEGTPVAILTADETTIRLSAGEEEELLAALDDIRRGHYVDGRELLRDLRALADR